MDQPDFFPTLPRRTVEKSERQKWNEFRHDQSEAGGLVAGGAVRLLLGISKQRLHQIHSVGLIRSYVHFGERYYSVADVEERLRGIRDGTIRSGYHSLVAA